MFCLGGKSEADFFQYQFLYRFIDGILDRTLFFPRFLVNSGRSKLARSWLEAVPLASEV
jgi:hypothetical protein